MRFITAVTGIPGEVYCVSNAFFSQLQGDRPFIAFLYYASMLSVSQSKINLGFRQKKAANEHIGRRFVGLFGPCG